MDAHLERAHLERFKRGEQLRDARAARAANQTLNKYNAVRNATADFWAAWFRAQMEGKGTAPTQLLPEALAKLEQHIEDRIAIAAHEIRAALRKALAP